MSTILGISKDLVGGGFFVLLSNTFLGIGNRKASLSGNKMHFYSIPQFIQPEVLGAVLPTHRTIVRIN